MKAVMCNGRRALLEPIEPHGGFRPNLRRHRPSPPRPWRCLSGSPFSAGRAVLDPLPETAEVVAEGEIAVETRARLRALRTAAYELSESGIQTARS